MKSKVQYDRINGVVKSSKQYRDEMLVELSKEINRVKEEGIKGIIIAGDINQDINHYQIQKFMRENELYEIQQEITNNKSSDRDNTYKNRRNQIDAIF